MNPELELSGACWRVRSGRGLSSLLAGALLAVVCIPAELPIRPVHAGGGDTASPSFDRQVNLVYTVNNFGYTDVCG